MSEKWMVEKGNKIWIGLSWLRAALGLTWWEFYNLFIRVNPKTGMTDYQLSQHLAETQDPREVKNLEKSEKAAEITAPERAKRAEAEKERERQHKEAVEATKQSYEADTEKDQARYWENQNELEERRINNEAMRTSQTKPLAREPEISSAPPQPYVSNPAYDQYEARKNAI